MIATAHLETQTAIIWSVLTLKLHLSDNILQNQVVQLQLGDEDNGAATVLGNVIWVVEDLFWLAVAVSFDFLFTRTVFERLAGCFSSMCRFRFAVDVVDVRSCFLKPGGWSLHKKVRFFPPGSSLTFS